MYNCLEAQWGACIICNNLFEVMKKVNVTFQDNVLSLHPTQWKWQEKKKLSQNSFDKNVEHHQEGCDWPTVRLESTLSNSSLLRRFSVMLLLSSNLGRMTAMYPSVDGCLDGFDRQSIV